MTNTYNVLINNEEQHEAYDNDIERVAAKIKNNYDLNYVVITDELNKKQTIYGFSKDGEQKLVINITKK